MFSGIPQKNRAGAESNFDEHLSHNDYYTQEQTKHGQWLGIGAERLQLRHHSAVGLIDRLVTEKLVVRAPSKEDWRQVMIQLPRRGEQTLAKLSTIHRTQIKQLGPELGLLLEWLGCTNY